MTRNQPKRRCPRCGTTYILGVNGIGGGCDKCMHVQRDQQGYAWYSHERMQKYVRIATGEQETVTRDEAFGK